jgi:hypothetical protein
MLRCPRCWLLLVGALAGILVHGHAQAMDLAHELPSEHVEVRPQSYTAECTMKGLHNICVYTPINPDTWYGATKYWCSIRMDVALRVTCFPMDAIPADKDAHY